ncbi:MAG: DUF3305 domain-containing protein [Alphaproteobacteria bacterium]|nr:DUF3305 domain-containing protein [Alphaproteobacteria bacterium]
MFERRRIDHPWQEWRWKPVAVIPGAAGIAEPKLLREEDGWTWYQLATLDLELFPGETADYRLNLSQKQPMVYVLWRSEISEPENRPEPFHVTVCHTETQDYLDGGDVVAEGVPMPDAVRAILQDYVRAHHVDMVFKKRKRSPLMPARNADDDHG